MKGQRMPMTQEAASGASVSVHTRDEASPLAANGPLRVALFRPGAKAICACRAGDCEPSECNALYVLAEDGDHVATFWGCAYRAMVQEPTSNGTGGLCIYRMPQTTGDAATDAAASLIRNRLAEMSAANAAFWARRDRL